jgi:hypothetical protein
MSGFIANEREISVLTLMEDGDYVLRGDLRKPIPFAVLKLSATKPIVDSVPMIEVGSVKRLLSEGLIEPRRLMTDEAQVFIITAKGREYVAVQPQPPSGFMK